MSTAPPQARKTTLIQQIVIAAEALIQIVCKNGRNEKTKNEFFI